MKKQIITYVFIGAMLTTSLICGNASADMKTRSSMESPQGRMEMKHENRFEMMAGLLDLTETQQEQILAIHEQQRAGHEETRQSLREGHEKMRELLDGNAFDETAIRSLAVKLASLKAEMFLSRVRLEHEVFQLLNKDQQALAKKIQPLLHEPKGLHQPAMAF